MSSLSYDSILEALATLSFADKLRLNEELATALRKEGKSGAVGKAIKKEKRVKDPSAKPRKTAAGTLAWIAFVKHCKSSFPERFEDCTKEPERLQVAKAIRAEDEAAYKEFCEKFKEEHASAAGSDQDGSDSEGESSPPAAPAPDRAAKLAELSAKMAAKKGPALAGGALAGAAPAAKPAPKEKKEEKKPAPAPKEEKPAKAAKPKKEVKKAAAPPPAEELPTMEKKTIAGVDYFFDPENNGLWMVEDGDEMGAWVGRFQPDEEDEDNQIRFTDSPTDE